RSGSMRRQLIELLLLNTDRRMKQLAVVTLLLVLGSAVTAAIAPVLFKVAVDGLELGNRGLVETTYLVIAYALTHWLARSFGEWRGMFYALADHRMQRQLTEKLFQHVLSLPLRFHLDRE